MQTEELPGRPDAESSVFVAVTSVDICTQQPLGFSLGFREDLGDALDLDRLDAASLAATVQMRELGTADSAPYTMDIQLQWTGIGEPSRPASTSCSTTSGSG